jgi:hypothetical protein
MALVRAIKFAKPDASQRSVHSEITQVLSQKEACLKDITLNDVKKVWKKAVTAASAASGAPGGVVKLFTVGDGTVSILANQYSQNAAKAAVEEQVTEQHYVHVYLDVPMDRSGSRPHQAIINFRDNNDCDDCDASAADTASERGEIVKIQVASTPNGEKVAMLMYNADRTAKTFIHPDIDGGYDRIYNWIVNEGIGGALGAMGGSKAYFYCRRTILATGGPDIISIDVKSLAPHQTW